MTSTPSYVGVSLTGEAYEVGATPSAWGYPRVDPRLSRSKCMPDSATAFSRWILAVSEMQLCADRLRSSRVGKLLGMMPAHLLPTARSLRAIRAGAIAAGALSIGAIAVGALALGFVAVKRLAVARSHFGSIEIDELTVRRLNVGDVFVDGGRARFERPLR